MPDFPRRDPSRFADRRALLDQVAADYFDAVDAGRSPAGEELVEMYPEIAAELREFLDAHGCCAGPLRRVATAHPGFEPTAPGDFGDYELVEIIGRGGMGVVYRARHRRLGREVALKTLLAGARLEPEARSRFERECRAAAQIDHPNVVPLFEIGEHDGVPFYSMPLIEGGDLDVRRGEFESSPRAAASILAKVARAVEAAHRQGIVHRDLKPANILLDRQGVPFVVDFGLAAAAEVSAGLTRTGIVLGTPAYVAPEAIAQGARACGPTADVYSLGVILYELLTSRPPFSASTALELLRAAREDEPKAPRALRGDLPRDLETITLTCLEKNPARRYRDAGALADDLDRFLAAEPIASRPIGRATRAWRWTRRHPWPAALVAVLLAVTCGSVAAAIAFEGERAEARAAARAALDSLWDALLSQARQARESGWQGQRQTALAALEKAVRIRPESILRDEAIAALALHDLELTWSMDEARRTGTASAALSEDGALLARGGHDGTVVIDALSDSAAPCVLDRAAPQRASVRSLDFGSNGAWIAARYEEGQRHVVAVWKIESGEMVPPGGIDVAGPRAWDLHPRRAAAVAAAADGSLLFLDDADVQPERKETPARRLEWRPWGDAAPPRRRAIDWMRFDARGERVAIGGTRESRVEVRAWPEGAVVAEIAAGARVYDAAWDRSGALLALAIGRRIEIWSPARSTPRVTLSGHGSQVTSLDFDPRGDLLASTSWDGTLRLWSPALGRELVRARSGNLRVRFRGDSGVLDVAGLRGRLERWAVRGSDVMHHFADERPVEDGLAGLEFDADGARLVTAGHGGLRIRDLASGAAAWLPAEGVAITPILDTAGRSLFVWTTAGLRRGAWSAGGALELAETIRGLPSGADSRGAVAATAACRWALVKDLRRGHAIATTIPDGALEAGDTVALEDFLGFEHLAISPDGRLVAAGERHYRRRVVRIWDASSGRRIVDLAVGGPARCAFDPEGRTLLTGSGEEYRSWDTATWSPSWTFPRDSASGVPGPAAFSHDGRRIALLRDDAVVDIVDAASGRRIESFAPPDASIVKALRFDRSSTKLAALTENNSAIVWDLAALERALETLGL